VYDFGWGAARFNIAAIAARLVTGELGYRRAVLHPESWRTNAALGGFALKARVSGATVEKLCLRPDLLRYPVIVAEFRYGSGVTSILIDGNHRLRAAVLLGIEAVPVIVVPGGKLGAALDAAKTFWRVVGADAPPKQFGCY
jgi:hypothetical protein